MFATVLTLMVFVGADDSSNFGAWHLDYATALQEVEHQDKPLFIVFDRVESDAGRMVASDQFMNEHVERALAADYIRLFVDVESEWGKILAEQFGATEFPRLVVIDRSRNWQVYRRSGSHSANEVLSILDRYRRTKITTDSSTTFQSSYSQPSTVLTTSTIMCRT